MTSPTGMTSPTDATGPTDATALTDADVQRLLAELTEPDRDRRQSAALELGRAPVDNELGARLAPILIDRLVQEPDFFVRETLTWVSVRHAEQMLPLLHAALAEPGTTRLPLGAQAQALHVLSKIGDPGSLGVAANYALTAPQDPVSDQPSTVNAGEPGAVLVKAFTAVAAVGGARAGEVLVASLRGVAAGMDPEVRSALVTALTSVAGREPGSLLGTLTEALEDPRPQVRHTVIDVLTGFPARSDVAEALGRAVADPDAQVALSALSALVGRAPTAARRAAIALLGSGTGPVDTDPRVGALARHAAALPVSR